MKKIIIFYLFFNLLFSYGVENYKIFNENVEGKGIFIELDGVNYFATTAHLLYFAGDKKLEIAGINKVITKIYVSKIRDLALFPIEQKNIKVKWKLKTVKSVNISDTTFVITHSEIPLKKGYSGSAIYGKTKQRGIFSHYKIKKNKKIFYGVNLENITSKELSTIVP